MRCLGSSPRGVATDNNNENLLRYPMSNTKVDVGILLKEEHYFTKSKHIIVYMCDKCGKTWSVNYK